LSLRFSLKGNNKKTSAELGEVFRNAQDPPVFYSVGMLKVLEKISGVKLQIALLHKNEIPILALPIVKKNIWTNANFPGWDNLDLVQSASALKADVDYFWTALLNEVKLLKLSSFSQKSTAIHLAQKQKFKIVDRRKCPYIPLKSSWEELNQTISKKLVRNLRQYGNKALRDGIHYKIREAQSISIEERNGLLRTAFAYHNMRMKDLNQDSKFTPEAFESYHKSVFELADNVFIIEAFNATGENIACFYGLFNKYRLAYFNGGFNQDYTEYSLGTLLVSELISFAYQENIKVFDFLRGREGYKLKWTDVFDWNKDIYLSNNNLFSKLKLRVYFFDDMRKRLGTKKALKLALAA